MIKLGLVYPFDLYQGSVLGLGFTQVPVALKRAYSELVKVGVGVSVFVEPDQDKNICRSLSLRIKDEHATGRFSLIAITYDAGSDQDLLFLCQELKKLHDPPVLVLGGRSVSLFPEAFLRAFPVDYIGLGDIDLILVSLTKALLENQDLRSAGGVAYLDDEKQLVQKKPLLQVNWTDQLVDWSKNKLFAWEKDSYVLLETGAMSCPFQCSFCVESRYADSIGIVRNKQLFSSEVIYDALRFFRDEREVEQVTLIDLDFLAYKDRALRLSRALAKEDSKLSISIWATANSISRYTDDELVDLSSGGINMLHVGFESFSDDQLRRYNKSSASLNKSTYRRLTALSYQGGPSFDPLFIPWDPETTLQDCIANFEFFKGVYSCPNAFRFDRLLTKMVWDPSLPISKPVFKAPSSRLAVSHLWDDEWAFQDPNVDNLYRHLRLMFEMVSEAQRQGISECFFCDRGTLRSKAAEVIQASAVEFLHHGSWAGNQALRSGLISWSCDLGKMLSKKKSPAFKHQAQKLGSFLRVSVGQARKMLC